MVYVNNKFCWHGIITSDIEKASAFYTDTIGWGTTTMEMGSESVTMVTAGDIPRAHVMLPPMEGVPNHISSYLRIEDVDAGVEAAVANGGKVVTPPTDIPPGRFSAVASPSGAVFLLFHEVNEDSARNPPPGDGAIHWVELHSTDIDKDVEWLTSSFGLSAGPMDMPNGGTYHILSDGDTQVGGAMQGMNPDAPSHWLVWIAVDDVDACLGRIKAEGGQVFNDPMDMDGIGRMAVAADNQGAAFGVITPAAA